jgi:hypothetical protein
VYCESLRGADRETIVVGCCVCMRCVQSVQLCCLSYRPFTHRMPSVFTRGSTDRAAQVDVLLHSCML